MRNLPVAPGARGRFGPAARYVYSNRLTFGNVRREEDILWSFAPHDISTELRLALAGEPPVSVHTEGSCHLHPSIADTTTMHLRFANGVHAHVYVSRLHPFEEQKLVVIGDKAMAVFDDGLPWQQKLTLFPHSIDWIDGQPEARKATGSAGRTGGIRATARRMPALPRFGCGRHERPHRRPRGSGRIGRA